MGAGPPGRGCCPEGAGTVVPRLSGTGQKACSPQELVSTEQDSGRGQIQGAERSLGHYMAQIAYGGSEKIKTQNEITKPKRVKLRKCVKTILTISLLKPLNFPLCGPGRTSAVQAELTEPREPPRPPARTVREDMGSDSQPRGLQTCSSISGALLLPRVHMAQPLPTLEVTLKLFLPPVMLNHEMVF